MLNIDPVLLLMELLVLIVSLSIHEAAHAWSADRLGDSTARQLGRLTINPVAHVDVFGTIVLPLMAMMLPGAPIIGYAKPVPVNTRNLGHDWRQKFMLVAAAGPASNLVIAMVGAAIFHLMPSGGFDGDAIGRGSLFVSFLIRVVSLNVLLAVFKMLPVPMLDGGNVLAGLLKGQVAQLYDNLRPYGFLILYALLLTGVFATVVTPIYTVVLGWLL
ncbi:MAG TPA: site-2 protease family protein [Vicinamibacterales bacterium]|nr:site-2 protease family protein [Vicinamibacterales bacterium]